MDVERKSATASVTPVEDSKSKHGEFDVILSTNALDRDGDELHADEWKTPLPDKITFDSDHGMTVATCVGSGKPFINDQGQLQVRGTFASTPHGQAVRTLVNEGHIDSVSVAFMDRKTQKSGKPLRELLNGAFVAVPANLEARVLSSKAAKDDGHNPKEPYGDVDYADPGFRNGIKRYPINDAGHVRAAWDYFHHAHDRDMYTPEQQKHIEDAIRAAGKKFGIHFESDDDGKKAASNYKLDEMASINDMFTNDPLDGADERARHLQDVHDLAVKLGAGCPYSDPSAIPGVLQSYNRSVQSEVTTKGDGLSAEPCNCSCPGCTCPSSKSLSPKSADESATADQKSATADESADDVTRAKALLTRLAITD